MNQYYNLTNKNAYNTITAHIGLEAMEGNVERNSVFNKFIYPWWWEEVRIKIMKKEEIYLVRYSNYQKGNDKIAYYRDQYLMMVSLIQ